MDEKSIKILEAIIMFGPISGPDILSYLKNESIVVNIKTIYSVIDKWNYLFSKIGDGTMAIIMKKKVGYSLNHRLFTDGQQRFLMDTIQSSSLLDNEEKAHMGQLLHLYPKSELNQKNEGFLHRLTIISKAIEEKKCIKFSYFDYDIVKSGSRLEIQKKYRQSGNDTKETYLISPYEIMMKKGQYYVLSYCDKHPDNVTIFRLDRMDKVRTAKNTYFAHLKEIVDYETKKNQMINMFIGTQQTEDIKIKFNKDVFKTIVDEFGTHMILSEDYDGQYIFELKNFAISEGLISWILMMGNQVEVLEPTSLKNTIYERLQVLVKKYKGGGQ